MSVHISCPFSNWIFFLLLNFKSSLHILDTSCQICALHIFSPNCSLFFYPFHRAKVFNLDEVKFISFSLWMILVSSQRTLFAYPSISKIFSCFFFPQSFIALHFTCKSMMNFELVEYVLIPVKINCFSQGEKGIV